MLNQPFTKVALIGRSSRLQQSTKIANILSFLEQHDVELFVEEETANVLQYHQAQQLTTNQFPDYGVELIIVVGGDGSMLHAARTAIEFAIPVVGINRGRLGFLTDIHPDELEQLAAILSGDYTSEERLMLQADVYHADNLVQQHIALNDVALTPGGTAHMLDFDIYINEQLVCHQRADGLIVTTPTGSTAYALSAGGPILSPGMDAVALVPMMPHKLSSRPLVVNSNSAISITINSLHDTSPCLSCDGMESLSLDNDSRIAIKAYDKKLKLIHGNEYSYYKTLRSKLGWESQ